MEEGVFFLLITDHFRLSAVKVTFWSHPDFGFFSIMLSSTAILPFKYVYQISLSYYLLLCIIMDKFEIINYIPR